MRTRKDLKKRYRVVKKKPVLENNVTAGTLALLLLLLFFYYFIVFYPKFQLQDVVTFSDRDIDHDSVTGFVTAHSTKKYFPKRTLSMFLINRRELERELAIRMPVIKNVNVVKVFPDIITVTVKERVPVAVWCYGKNTDRCLYIDSNGVAFQKARHYSSSFFTAINITDAPHLGSVVISPDDINILFFIKSVLEEENFTVRYFHIESKDKIDVYVNEGWRIIISLDNTERQLENLIAVYDTIRNKRSSLKYIDLRFGDRVYHR